MGTYIKLHRENILPHSEILDKKLKKELIENKGNYSLGYVGNKGGGDGKQNYFCELEYIDKDGDIVKVEISTENISMLNKKMDEKGLREIRGFTQEEGEKRGKIVSSLIQEELKKLKKLNYQPASPAELLKRASPFCLSHFFKYSCSSSCLCF